MCRTHTARPKHLAFHNHQQRYGVKSKHFPQESFTRGSAILAKAYTRCAGCFRPWFHGATLNDVPDHHAKHPREHLCRVPSTLAAHFTDLRHRDSPQLAAAWRLVLTPKCDSQCGTSSINTLSGQRMDGDVQWLVISYLVGDCRLEYMCAPIRLMTCFYVKQALM